MSLNSSITHVQDASSLQEHVRQHFTRRYVLALSIVAVIATVSQVSMQWVLQRELDEAHPTTVNVSGYQRMLSQRIGYSVLHAAYAPSAPEREAYLTQASALASEWTLRHDALLQGSDSLGLPGTSDATLRQHLQDIGQIQERALGLVDTLRRQLRAVPPAASLPPEAEARLASLRSLLSTFLDRMDAWVDAYDRHATTRFQWLQYAQLGLFVLVLASLGGVAFFVLRPTARRLGRLAANNSLLDQSNSRLEAAQRKAQQASVAKSAFLSNMHHEIRTPLTGILGAADMLHDSVAEQRRPLAAIIQRNGKRLKRTLTLLIDMARLESETGLLQTERVDACKIVRRQVQEVQPEAEAKGLDLHVNLPPGPVYADANAPAWGNATRQVLENAVEYTERGSVRVTLHADEEVVRVRIRDTGCGMTSAFQDRLFEPFEQESTGLRREHEGTGLGLSVAEACMDLMDGTIAVESTPGEGSLFVLCLPRSRRATQPDAALSEDAD